MIRVGIVGLGFMGWMHWLAYQKLRGVRVTAVCDRNAHRLKGDFRDARGNFGPPGRKVNLRGAVGHLDWRELVHDPSIDMVDITLPTGLHTEVAEAALRAGKHVLCEKPMARSSRDCRRMIRAAEQAGRTLLVAHVLPFFPEYAWALRAIQSGRYGQPHVAWFNREISEPTWMGNYWSAANIGGPMFDLHIHDAHFARLLFGMPKSVRATGTLRNGLPELWSWRFSYPASNPCVIGSCGVRDGCGWSFNHGFKIASEQVQLSFDFLVSNGKGHFVEPPVLTDYRRSVQRKRHPKLRGGQPLDAFRAELREATRAVRNGGRSQVLDPALAHDAVRICEAEAKSLKRGQSVRL